VLPVGGIKEKVLAAHRARVPAVILPAWNRKDVEDIPRNIQKEIRFHFVDRMMDVLELALTRTPPKRRPAVRRRRKR
jgi:ATP-dependent Lon protease